MKFILPSTILIGITLLAGCSGPETYSGPALENPYLGQSPPRPNP